MKEAIVPRCSLEKMFLEILQNSQENTCASLSDLQLYEKREFWEISKNNFFTEHLGGCF